MNTAPDSRGGDNLELSAQIVFGLKVAVGIAVLVAIVNGIASFMIWFSPFWSKWL